MAWSLIAWFSGIHPDPLPEDTKPDPIYPCTTSVLDANRDKLTDAEYDHIARVQVRLAEFEKNEEKRFRERIETENSKRKHEVEFGFHDWLGSFLCTLPFQDESRESCSKQECDSHGGDPEPALVMLDGSAASALARSKDKLTSDEYNHILQVQARIAEIDLEEECKRASRLRPRKLQDFADCQPKNLKKSRQESPEAVSVRQDSEMNLVQPTEAESVHIQAAANVVRIDYQQPLATPMGVDMSNNRRDLSTIQREATSTPDPTVLAPYAELFGFTPSKMKT
eukprot:m.33448 g.33448  ORF g.33448 m.33448 type:complete len:282 (-) comp14235_c0_seq1:2461-3306(-)